MTIHRCSFKDNRPEEFNPIAIENRGSLLLTASALTGGTFFSQNITNDGVLLMLNSTRERATMVGGGLSNRGTATVLNSTISGSISGTVTSRTVLLNLAGVEPHCRPDPLPHCAPADRPDRRPWPRYLHRRRHAGQRAFPVAPEQSGY